MGGRRREDQAAQEALCAPRPLQRLRWGGGWALQVSDAERRPQVGRGLARRRWGSRFGLRTPWRESVWGLRALSLEGKGALRL